MSEFQLKDLASVRITDQDDIRPAAEALHAVALERGYRVAPAHDIADKRTPVDKDGNVLAMEVFGWAGDESAWWRNSRIALDSPITTACRFENEPYWVNEDGFRTRLPNAYLEKIDLTNFTKRAMTRAAIVVPVHMAFGRIGAVSFNPLDEDRIDLAADYEEYADLFAILGLAPVEAGGRMSALGGDRQDRSGNQHDHVA